jgi:polyhydroxybutyrate depolymerase
MKNIIKIALTILISFSVNAQVKSLVFKGEKRKYIIYTPKSYANNSSKSYPVVFNFHGGGMTMAEQMLYTQMNKTADKNDFIVIYPKGIKEDWNVGFGMSYKNGIDDIGFIDSLLTKVSKDYRINSKKVFATGLSRGGFFCHRIGTELSHKFAAIASVGATMPDSVAIYHKSKNKIGVMIVHGTADLVVDYNGKKNDYYSALDTYKY